MKQNQINNFIRNLKKGNWIFINTNIKRSEEYICVFDETTFDADDHIFMNVYINRKKYNVHSEDIKIIRMLTKREIVFHKL